MSASDVKWLIYLIAVGGVFLVIWTKVVREFFWIFG
jgi:hypothetical protein